MPCLEPDKNLSKEAQNILLSLAKISPADRMQIAQDAGFNPPLVARKIRELLGKELITDNAGVYQLTENGKEAVNLLTKQ